MNNTNELKEAAENFLRYKFIINIVTVIVFIVFLPAILISLFMLKSITFCEWLDRQINKYLPLKYYGVDDECFCDNRCIDSEDVDICGNCGNSLPENWKL